MVIDSNAVRAFLLGGEQFDSWIKLLDDIGPPPTQLQLPRGVDALDALGIEPEDANVIAAATPSPDTHPEIWWLLERCYHGLVRDLGADEGGIGMCPALPGDSGRLYYAFVFLAASADVRRWHRDRGIPDDVSSLTLSCLGSSIASYRREHGETGLSSQWWLSMTFRGICLQIGRLQYIPYRLMTGPAGPLFWYDDEDLEPGFRPGDYALSVHVPPRAGALDDAAVQESLNRAARLYASCFPETPMRIATCTSWLLDDQLAEYLEPSANIARFQRRFTMVPGAKSDDGEILKRVFGATVDTPLESLPQRTTLERAIVKHLRAGCHWTIRTGWVSLA